VPLDLQFVLPMLNINKILIGAIKYFKSFYEYCHLMSRYYMTLIPYDTSVFIGLVVLIKLDTKKISSSYPQLTFCVTL
jgi:hypothetical protein